MDASVRILILDDRPADAALMQRELLKAGVEAAVECVTTKDEFLQSLEQRQPDLLIADYSLRGLDGLSALALARQRLPDLPGIIVSGMIGEESVVDILKRGATDFVLKERLGRLAPTVQRALAEARQLADRKRAEEAVRESEERLRFALETSHTGAWDLDLTDHTAFRSLEHDRIFGYPQILPQWTYEMFLEHVLPEDRPTVDAEFRHAVETRSDWSFECRIRRVDGQVRWIWAAGRHRSDRTGSLRRMAGIVQDITERKEAEDRLRQAAADLQAANASLRASRSAALNLMEDADAARRRAEQAAAALRESEERLRLLGDNLPDSAVYQYAHEPDGSVRFLYFSAGVERMNGIKTEDVLSDAGTLHRQILPEYFDRFVEAEARSKRELSDFDMEVPMRRPDGQVRWIRLHSRPRRMADGRTLWDGVQIDITERKRVEANERLAAKVLELLNRGEDLHDLISETIRLIGRETGFDAVGLRMRDGDDFPYYEQTGFPAAFVQEENSLCAKGADGAIVRDAEGKPVFECTCGLVLAGRTDPAMPCFTESGSFWTNASSELLTLAPHEDPRTNPRNRCIHTGYQSVALIPLRLGDEIVGLLQLNDRRPGRFTPESIRFFEGLAVSLAIAIRRRQVEESLREAAENLKRSNEDLQQFAYVASHDLQEPLRMVASFVKLLELHYASQLDARAREYIDFAVDGAQRMSQLITDLLSYSRVERMGQPLQPTDANQALAHALAALRASIEEAGATITHDHLPTVAADPTQLIQLFQNLIGNAVKFRHPDRPCQVHVGAEMQDGQWLLSIRDNGIGIEPKQYQRVFVIFQRLHTREKYPGTGIGLAICKKIVERHGGRIWLKSKSGEGSTFFFTLPNDAAK